MQSDQHIDHFLSKHMMTGSKISYHGLVKGLTIHSILRVLKALMYGLFHLCFYFLNIKRITLKYLHKRSIGHLSVIHHWISLTFHHAAFKYSLVVLHYCTRKLPNTGETTTLEVVDKNCFHNVNETGLRHSRWSPFWSI